MLRATRLKTQVERRFTTAGNYLADAELLAAIFEKRSDGDYLLKLLGFELLLKTVSLIHGGRTQGHRYDVIFKALPAGVPDRIVRAAGEHMTTSADYSDVPRLLATFEKNFVALRYPFEKYDDLTAEEYRELGEEWVERGGLEADATFTYHPEELHGLIHALDEEVGRWLDSTSGSESFTGSGSVVDPT